MRKTPFICLLNAMEYAAQSADPLKEGHRDKRKAVLAYVSDLERRLAAIRAQTIEECVSAVNAEPELPGEPPDEMVTAIQGCDKDLAIAALRIVVIHTKDGIRERIREMK